jgi:sulfonate transport system ATP-binding protein
MVAMASAFQQRKPDQESVLNEANDSNLNTQNDEKAVDPSLTLVTSHHAVSNTTPEKHGLTVEIDRVVKRFDERAVLSDIQLSIQNGEFVAIVGRSGCGKSTLLRLIAGLDSISDGRLELDGSSVNGINPETRIMFQDARLLPWRDILDNVKIGIAGASSTDQNSKAREALKLVGLQDRAGEWPSVLSGGQRQRVALARALVGDPRLLLLDEPLGALDALTRIEMQRLIERLWERQGFTAVLVTHDVSEAVALADRVILIEEGRIALDVAITLARPREKDNSFSYFEKYILDRVLTPEVGDEQEQKQQAGSETYSI